MDNVKNIDNQLKSFDIKAFAFKALGYWYLFVIAVLIAVGYSYYKVRYYVPQYTVDSRIIVKDEFSSWGQEYFLPGMELVSERNRLVNEIGSFRSFPLMRKVVDNLESFRVFYFDHGNIKVSELYQTSPFVVNLDSTDLDGLRGFSYFLRVQGENGFELSANDDFKEVIPGEFGAPFKLNGKKIQIDLKYSNFESLRPKTYSFTINDLDYLAKYYQGSLSVRLEDKASSILILGKSGTEINKEIDFLNQLIETYIQNGLERSNQIASKTIEFVDGQIARILDTLIISEQQLQQFKSGINVRRIPLEEQGLISELSELEKNKLELELRLKFYDEVLNQLNSDADNEIILPSFIAEGAVRDQIGNLNELYQEFLKSDFILTEENKVYQRALEKIRLTKKKIIQTLVLEQELETAKFSRTQASIAVIESKVADIPVAERDYVNLRRTYQLNSDLYTFLLQKKSEASIARASNISKVQVLDYASPLRVRYSGLNTTRLYLTSIAAGLVVPLAIVFLINFFNTRIIDRNDLEAFTKIPIIGVIGHNDKTNNLVIFNSPRSMMSESFRTIRTQINFLAPRKESTVILLSSSISGEGKTFCSINLSSAYSSLGKKTILIGADLRRPKIYDDFDIENNVGLSDCLIGHKTLDEAVIKTEFDNIHILTSGPIPPNPSELLDTQDMADLMVELRSKYDVVIIDTPPVGLVADALLLQKYVDVNLYVVRQRYTRKNHLDIINNYYEKDHIKNIGIIINDVKLRKVGYGGYYGYGYGYGYGYSKEYY